MSRNFYVSGQFNVLCDVCNKKIKAGQAKQRWDGFIVCPDDYEERQPQDFVRAKQDKISVPYSRPRTRDIFVDNGNRTISEQLILQDIIAKLLTSTLPNEVLALYDARQDYVESTYFLEDYITNNLIIHVDKNIIEILGLTDTGNINTQNYIEYSYFAEDYIGNNISF